MRGVFDRWLRPVGASDSAAEEKSRRAPTLAAVVVIAATFISVDLMPRVAVAAENSPSTAPAATLPVRCPSGERLVDQHCIRDPILLKHPSANYPPGAMASRIEGSVTVKAVIAENGRITDAVVEECTSPGRGFEDAANEAVRKRRYKPAKVDGKVTAVTSRVVIDFKL